MRTLFLIAILLPSIGFAQLTDEEVREIAKNASEEELVMRSSEMIQQNFLYHAEFLVDRLLEIKPQSANYNYRKGFIIYTAYTDYVNGI